MKVRFVPREEIDKVKWNSCVHYALNGNLFGYMWYLDAAARSWDALVEGDYESVMPLPWQQHWWRGKVLRQPDLIRQTDIYSIHVLSSPRVGAFWEALTLHYQRGQLITDTQCTAPAPNGGIKPAGRNFLLPLLDGYEVMAERLSPGLLDQLKQAREAQLEPNNNLKPERIAALYRQQDGRGAAAAERFHALQRIMYQALHRGWGFPAGVQAADGTLLAADFLGLSHDRLISLAPARLAGHPQADAAQAYLYYHVLRQHAGRPVLLDFNVRQEGDARRARDFGATILSDQWAVSL